MKKLIVLCMALVLFVACKKTKKEEIAEVREIQQYSIAQFMDNENAFANGNIENIEIRETYFSRNIQRHGQQRHKARQFVLWL